MKIKKIRDFNINQQLIASFIVIIIISIVLFSTIIYKYFERFLETGVTKSFKVVNSQITRNLDTFFKNIAKISEMPFYDNDIQKILVKDYSKFEYPEFEKIQGHYIITDEFFKTIFLLNDFIDSVDLYPNNSDVLYTKGFNQTINYEYSPKNEQWYKDIINKDGEEIILGLRKNKQVISHQEYIVTVGRSIKTHYKNDILGVFLINIKVDTLKRLYEEVKLSSKSRQLIVDQNNNIVYSNNNYEIGQPINKEISKHFNDKSKYVKMYLNEEEVLIVINSSKYTSWKVISIISSKDLYTDIIIIRNLIYIAGVILIILSIIVSLFISKSISKPIKQLRNLMKKFEYGSLNENVEVKGNKEINELSKTYNKMLGEIKNLINQIENDEENKRIAELNALQAQINPHFMYNTLNVVKLMAEMQGADNITNALNSFIYLLTFAARTNETYISIREEIEFLKNYISILGLRYYNKFSVNYDIDERIYDYKILKFIIQPFIENAIFHGFVDNNKINSLELKGRIYQDTIVFNIIDNGEGMSDETIQNVLNSEIEEKKGFNSIGINNVVNRMKLYYGEDFGVNIKSKKGKGTEIEIKIPALYIQQSVNNLS